MSTLAMSFSLTHFDPSFSGWLKRRKVLNTQGFFYGHAAMQSRRNQSIFNPNLARPFCYSKRLAVMCYKPIVSFVIGLLNIIRPSTIFRSIGTIIINSINACSNWFFAHVGIKMFKRKPPVAYRNSSSAIPRKIFTFWVKAPVFNAFPNTVYFCSGHTMLHKNSVGESAVIVNHKSLNRGLNYVF